MGTGWAPARARWDLRCCWGSGRAGRWSPRRRRLNRDPPGPPRVGRPRELRRPRRRHHRRRPTPPLPRPSRLLRVWARAGWPVRNGTRAPRALHADRRAPGRGPARPARRRYMTPERRCCSTGPTRPALRAWTLSSPDLRRADRRSGKAQRHAFVGVRRPAGDAHGPDGNTGGGCGRTTPWTSAPPRRRPSWLFRSCGTRASRRELWPTHELDAGADRWRPRHSCGTTRPHTRRAEREALARESGYRPMDADGPGGAGQRV